MAKIKTKYRLEYWEGGRKFVKIFGSHKQAVNWVESRLVSNISIRPFQERQQK